MSEDIRVNITRAGVTNPIAQNIYFQLDKLSLQEASTFQGADPYFTYRAITIDLPMVNPLLVQYRDYLVDQAYIDPITNLPRQFLIVSDPAMHILNGHWEFICTRVRGT